MELQQLIDRAKRIVFFGGAGVSTESGIPDFRSAEGLYGRKYKYPPETVLSHDFFMRMTKEFYRFYRDKMIFDRAMPNAAHLKLAELERAGRLTAVVTQNIDGLHYDAGSKTVYELHGSVKRNHCMMCGRRFGIDTIKSTKDVPLCGCGGIIKPDVVLYGEPTDMETFNGAQRAIVGADLLIIGGTSLRVYPAAGLIRFFRGDNIVLINRDATSADSEASLVIREPIGRVLGGITVN